MDHADPHLPPRLGPSVGDAPVVRPRTGPLRTSTWRGRDDVTLVIPRPDVALPTPGEVAAVVAQAGEVGTRRLITGALTDAEQAPFLATGFSVHDRLHLLRHDLDDLPDPPTITSRLRRARARDHPTVLVVDARAFEPFWRLDQAGLEDALGATTSARFRVAADPEVVGYAVTGRAGDRGYVQRLAVEPHLRGRGLGAALVLDGLRWLRRRRASSAVVNTQVGNEAAYALYQRLGFVPQPSGLTVLSLDLSAPRGPSAP